jgi:hypothetical protein
MKKDSPLAFRIPGELKARLQRIAEQEARSISQVCEMLLELGADAYAKEGGKYLDRFMSTKRTRNPRQT